MFCCFCTGRMEMHCDSQAQFDADKKRYCQLYSGCILKQYELCCVVLTSTAVVVAQTACHLFPPSSWCMSSSLLFNWYIPHAHYKCHEPVEQQRCTKSQQGHTTQNRHMPLKQDTPPASFDLGAAGFLFCMTLASRITATHKNVALLIKSRESSELLDKAGSLAQMQ